jgi:hypothetical protein
MHREFVEALHRVRGILKDLEEMIDSCQFQHHGRSRRDCSELEIAVPLQNLLHANQEKLDACAIHLADIGEVEDDFWVVSLE